MIQSPTNHSTLLTQLSKELDIPQAIVDKVVDTYNQIAAWLCEPDSPLVETEPWIYPQGSFRLGTMIRPSTGEEEYDIDLVCRLVIRKQNITQKELKALVGVRLRQHPEYRKILKEGRRCWTLHFSDAFHLDILPAIPDEEGLPDSILITDRELHRWQHSDPINYATWFQERMKVTFEEQRQIVAKSLGVTVDKVPMWRVKTPLQVAVQLLKRHRDLHFKDDQDDKPVSIIITTLAGHAYDNSPDVYTALLTIVEGMRNHIENRNGVIWIPNPVNPEENFADKWEDKSQRAIKFDAWLSKVHKDLTRVVVATGIHESAMVLKSSFGDELVTRALTSFGHGVRATRDQGQLRVEDRTENLNTQTGRTVPRHTFHGPDSD